ncbi:hypothetical protein D3C87_1614790 [compost metagenome]
MRLSSISAPTTRVRRMPSWLVFAISTLSIQRPPVPVLPIPARPPRMATEETVLRDAIVTTSCAGSKPVNVVAAPLLTKLAVAPLFAPRTSSAPPPPSSVCPKPRLSDCSRPRLPSTRMSAPIPASASIWLMLAALPSAADMLITLPGVWPS